MPYTVYQLARLAAAAYEPFKIAVAGWRLMRGFRRQPNGFSAALYKENQASRYVLALRGSDDGMDFVPDLQVFMGRVPNQYADAEVALRRSREVAAEGQLALTGHSLGGGLAILLAAKQDLPAVVFNAPGVSRAYGSSIGAGLVPIFGTVLGRMAQSWLVENENILSLRAGLDVVSVGTGEQIGRVVTLRVAGCPGSPASRSPGRMARAMAEPEFAQQVMSAAGSFPVDVEAQVAGSVLGAAAEDAARQTVHAGAYVYCQHLMALMEQQLKNMPEYNKPLDWANAWPRRPPPLPRHGLPDARRGGARGTGG